MKRMMTEAMERQNVTRVITPLDIWKVFVQHLLPIVMAAVLCVAALFAVENYIKTPEYASTSTLYILKQDNSSNYVYTQPDFTLALNVVNDCTYMVKSHEVLDAVINELNLNMSYEQLYEAISIKNPDNTRVLEVTAETTSPELSKKIVDAVCSKASKKINDIMGIDQVNIYAKGAVEAEPSNSVGVFAYALVAIVAAVLAFSAYLIAFMLDDRINTEEDVKKYLNLSVLGDIPNSNNPKHNNGKYKYNTYASKPKTKTQGGKAK